MTEPATPPDARPVWREAVPETAPRFIVARRVSHASRA